MPNRLVSEVGTYWHSAEYGRKPETKCTAILPSFPQSPALCTSEPTTVATPVTFAAVSGPDLATDRAWIERKQARTLARGEKEPRKTRAMCYRREGGGEHGHSMGGGGRRLVLRHRVPSRCPTPSPRATPSRVGSRVLRRRRDRFRT